jgi:hypothetical protein
MSQRTVQRVIGQLLTDDELRRRFVLKPAETIADLRDQGYELTRAETDAILQTDVTLWDAAAARIHPRLQRCCLKEIDP